MASMKQGLSTGYYGTDGSIMPVFSCGSMPLSPSFLSGDGKHLTLWLSIVLHVVALGLNMAANIAFFVNSSETEADIIIGWAACSFSMHILAVLGTVVSTAFIRDVFKQPIINTIGLGLFVGALLATAKVSYTHGLTHPATSVENINYNLSLFFQGFALASLFANSICSHGKGI
jgi:hypothetical protein